jgi:uncharacterized membrane protein YgcG
MYRSLADANDPSAGAALTSLQAAQAFASQCAANGTLPPSTGSSLIPISQLSVAQVLLHENIPLSMGTKALGTQAVMDLTGVDAATAAQWINAQIAPTGGSASNSSGSGGSSGSGSGSSSSGAVAGSVSNWISTNISQTVAGIPFWMIGLGVAGLFVLKGGKK